VRLPTNTSAEARTRTDCIRDPAKIAEADKKPKILTIRKISAVLLQIRAMKQDAGLLAESARILERANSLKTGDLDVLVALGNAKFDIAYADKNNAGFASAREIYTKALELKPGIRHLNRPGTDLFLSGAA
jgi:hypothetical protein